MSDKLRCAVIGAGAIGHHHLQSLLRCPAASLVALAESDPLRRREAAECYGLTRVYADYRELLEQTDIEAVTIALPNYLHAQTAIDCLRAGKHVLLEKPMAMNAQEAAQIIETARSAKRLLTVAQNFRFNRHTQVAKGIIAQGLLGEIYHARCQWLRRFGIPRIGSWFTQKQYAGGGCTLDIGVHMLDACLHLLGDFEVTSVSAQTFSKLGPQGVGNGGWGKSEIDPGQPCDVEDFSVALLKQPCGRTIILETSWAAHQLDNGREQGIDLLGTLAGLALFPARLIRAGALGQETIDLTTGKLPYPEDRVHHFVNCVVHGQSPLVTMEESLKVQQILDALYASAASGKEVVLPPDPFVPAAAA